MTGGGALDAAGGGAVIDAGATGGGIGTTTAGAGGTAGGGGAPRGAVIHRKPSAPTAAKTMTPPSRATAAKIGVFAWYRGGSGVWSGAEARRERNSLKAVSPSKTTGRFLRFHKVSGAAAGAATGAREALVSQREAGSRGRSAPGSQASSPSGKLSRGDTRSRPDTVSPSAATARAS